MQVCKCCVRARANDTAVLVAVQRRAPTSSGGLKTNNSRHPPRPSAQTLATGAEEKKEETRDTSMEDLAQSTEVLAALEVARARSQDAAESVADLSDFFAKFLRATSTEARRVSMEARRTAVTSADSRSATSRSCDAIASAIWASISTFWDLGEMGRASF